MVKPSLLEQFAGGPLSSIAYIRIAKDTLDPDDDWITCILQIVIANFEIINIATNTTLTIIIRSMQ